MVRKICRVLPYHLPQIIQFVSIRKIARRKVEVLELCVRTAYEAMLTASRIVKEAGDKVHCIDGKSRGLHGSSRRIFE